MRNFHLTLVLVLSGLTLFAQGEYPFLTEGKQWVQEEYISGVTDTAILTYYEFALGDTVEVDGFAYTQLVVDTSFNSSYSGLLREIDGRLLVLRSEEIDTLMDFNLEVGDTFVVERGRDLLSSQYMALLSIDSVTVFDGSVRKQLNFELNNVGFDGGGFAVSWIDGIGSTRGTVFQ